MCGADRSGVNTIGVHRLDAAAPLGPLFTVITARIRNSRPAPSADEGDYYTSSVIEFSIRAARTLPVVRAELALTPLFTLGRSSGGCLPPCTQYRDYTPRAWVLRGYPTGAYNQLLSSIR